ncbi:MAG TPA: cupin domain-containing protein [Myxococcaceae bacterium]|nr:cupin domain-containing protein [Myxococcaceae bacterium]
MFGRNLLSLGVVALLTLTACGQDPSQKFGQSSHAVVGPPPMIAYSPRGGPIDCSTFFSLGAPENLGGVTVEGNVEIFAKIDYAQNGAAAGLFMATPGTVQITFPFTEHATILEGEVTLTDSTGKRVTYRPGDTYFIRQGEVVLWEVKGRNLVKSFFNIVEAAPQN